MFLALTGALSVPPFSPNLFGALNLCWRVELLSQFPLSVLSLSLLSLRNLSIPHRAQLEPKTICLVLNFNHSWSGWRKKKTWRSNIVGRKCFSVLKFIFWVVGRKCFVLMFSSSFYENVKHAWIHKYVNIK